MATLTVLELNLVRKECAKTLTVNYTKAQINAATQAVEDQVETARTQIGTAIDAAAPGVFSAAQKKKIVAELFRLKYEKDR